MGGLARSGTSALCEMLNAHPRIALGMERYKYGVGTGALFARGPAAFERDAFFDIREDETNIGLGPGRYRRLYADLAAKYDNAAYVGDKVPGYHRHARRLLGAFPGARIVLIWRPLAQVAMSWDRRTRDDTPWPAANDAEAAVAQGLGAYRLMLDAAREHPDSVRLVAFDRIFAPGDEAPARLVGWLGLGPDPAFEAAVARMREEAARLESEREPVRPEVRARADAPEVAALMRELEAATA